MTPAGGEHQHHSASSMAERKTQHLEICLDDTRYAVETGTTRLDEVHLVHRSLPELDADRVDTSISFLSQTVRMPVFVESMTGGSAEGYRANKDLAQVAEQLGIPVGMGSIRILLRKPEVIDHFRLKRLAPSVPVFANIGGVNLPESDHGPIFRLIEELEVDGIAIHLNPGQELFQPGGDRDFSGILEAIESFCHGSPVPVIVKETGFGINPAEVEALLGAGAHLVNIAGAGGTNWVRVEGFRHEDPAMAEAAAEFDSWGLPTGLALAALGREQRRVIASGGMRSGMDVLRALALGAESCGLALPFIRALHAGGVAGAVAYGRRLEHVLRAGMTLSGSREVEDLRHAALWLEHTLERDAAALAQACGRSRYFTQGQEHDGGHGVFTQ